MRSRGVIGVVLGGLLVGLVACAPNEDELKRDFKHLVDQSNDCTADTDCVTVSPGCPLGCTVAVHRKHETAVRREAADLIEDYERWGRACAYECIGPLEPPTCTEHECKLGEPIDFSQPDGGTAPTD